MIITIASPDKISIAMFMSLMNHCLGKDLFIGEVHSLMTEESLSLYIEDMNMRSNKVLITYYARKKINADPLKVIPEKLLNASDLVVWINLYSTDWVIVKDPGNIVGPYLERWKRNIDRLNSVQP
jgi:hypothetical protein